MGLGLRIVVDWHGGLWIMGFGFGVMKLGVDLGMDWRFWIWVLILDLGSAEIEDCGGSVGLG